ncbi:bifunctional 4-hydroxy-2-oxoglutarate aldolase/2-dehydro-3-deoxy-phosphogluconate aldolase [Natronospirillum operosum]|uniref:2-dehydro-3-deoxy-phosphogluconate aldolase n=1 Tax=Natronospirillum operosum TaxID=2759953 RepID=A0A4Z0WFH2_9GAMM|nr:bifunctional 4-hydroxy-2-oxoglutarate aldolase/2-dehydro-3-deoxy-phosphogluconate aldolase [Natronospirillum operosum]TGG93901.1 bifunctional 4-hydroxy-2-oxoglutarate aldolase/2-dehydro-3-deoxy-phosphogluconate aldolase [Natronospirillum operosum]
MTAPMETLLKQARPVIPVLALKSVPAAIEVAKALHKGGISVLEVTLRTDAALDIIRELAQIPELTIGAGTVTNPDQLDQAVRAGARFAVSPGATPNLLTAGRESAIPLLPGVATASELMAALDAGYHYLKFFPAEVAGGVAALKALAGPFPQVRFCPTGGIGRANYQDYLALPSVVCVGGSWLVPADLLAQEDWAGITHLAAEAVALGH